MAKVSLRFCHQAVNTRITQLTITTMCFREGSVSLSSVTKLVMFFTKTASGTWLPSVDSLSLTPRVSLNQNRRTTLPQMVHTHPKR
jgi:hypothetical protein